MIKLNKKKSLCKRLEQKNNLSFECIILLYKNLLKEVPKPIQYLKMLAVDEFQLDLITVIFSYFNISETLACTWIKAISQKMNKLLFIFGIAEQEWKPNLCFKLSKVQFKKFSLV